MAKKKVTEQELAQLEQLKNFMQQFGAMSEPKIDVAKAQSYLERAAKYQEMALAILRGEEISNEPEPGKNRVGRPRKPAPEGDLFEQEKAPAEPRQRVGGRFVKRQAEAVTPAEIEAAEQA